MHDALVMARRIAYAVLPAAVTVAVLATVTVATAQTAATTGKGQKKTQRSAASRPVESGANAAETSTAKSAEQKKPTQKTASGQQAAVDPATGQLRPPTAEESQELTAAQQASVGAGLEDLTLVELPDGTLMVDLEDRIEDIAMATKDASGKASVVCVHGSKAMEAVLNHASTAPETAGTRASKMRAKRLATAKASGRSNTLEEK